MLSGTLQGPAPRHGGHQTFDKDLGGQAVDVRDTGEAGGGHQGKRSRQPRVRGELDGRSQA